MKFISNIFILLSFLISYSDNPINEFVGVGQQGTCYQCHNTYPPNIDGNIEILGLPEIIEPGERINLEIRINNDYFENWGFQIASVFNINGAPQGSPLVQGGTLEIIDTIQTISEESNGITYIKQTQDGTQTGESEASWIVEWTAPENYYGYIQFYATGVSGNQAWNNLGDYTYSTQKSVFIPPIYDELFNIDYQSQVQPIFNSFCISCHNEDFQYNNNGYIFTNWGEVISGGSVIPGNPEASLLYDAIEHNDIDNGATNMPYFSFEIPQNFIDIIYTWIEEGAESESCITGDYNGDSVLNIQDIVIITDCILNANCQNISCIDIDDDGLLTVADIVALVSLIIN
ncbi:hypothetical protein OAI93_00230 [bacterium]|nr:hypothetical protein [bacterium]